MMGLVVRRLIVLLVATALLGVACGGDDGADPEAFCELIRAGVGIQVVSESSQEDGLQALLEVAPDDIEDAVQELANTTRGLRDIDELDQLFDAAFDPDAQAARDEFNAYAVDICGYEGEALSDGELASATDLLNDLRTFVAQSFTGESWTSKVRYDVTEDDGALVSVDITFIIGAIDDEPIQACNAVSVYAYSLQDATGDVTVIDDDLVVARRAGPEASGCSEA